MWKLTRWPRCGSPFRSSKSSCLGWPVSVRANSSLRAMQKWKSEIVPYKTLILKMWYCQGFAFPPFGWKYFVKPTQRENQYFVRFMTCALCKHISTHHSRVVRRDQLRESRCRRKSTIPTSTRMTSTSTGMSCCRRLVYTDFSSNITALGRPSPSWCPRRTTCLNRSGETLGFSRALGKH